MECVCERERERGARERERKREVQERESQRFLVRVAGITEPGKTGWDRFVAGQSVAQF